MPSPQPLPSIAQLVSAATGSPSGDAPSGTLQGERDQYGDGRSGSLYNHTAGPAAVLWSRESQRDQDLFSDIYYDDASDTALTDLIQTRYPQYPRALDTYGQGLATFQRSSTSAGQGQLLRGTRIQVTGAVSAIYMVAADTTVNGPTAIVPAQATVLGTGQAINTSASLSLLDPVYDPLWLPISLNIADGTNFEPAADYRARVRTARVASRRGYVPSIVTACMAAGAAYVLGVPSTQGLAATDYADDFGLNAIYVGDANFQSTAAMINACTVALEGVRSLGCDTWVGGFSQQRVGLVPLISLVDDPGRLPIVPIRRAITQALLSFFGSTQGLLTIKRQSISGIIQQASAYVQTISWTDTTGGTYPSVGVYVNGALTNDSVFVPGLVLGNLPRYTLAPLDIQLYFTPPV